jgi:Predicted transcriptional regulator
MVARLMQGPASMKELAAPLGLALPSALKHLQVLENGGIVRSRKSGRVRTFAIERQGLEAIEAWLDEHRRQIEAGFDRLEDLMRSIPEEPSR